MSEQERAAGQAASTGHVGGGATDSEREAVAREIGALLAQARESQRLSVEDVSARLKVAAPKLAAVEAGDLAALPDVTFAKGVMRAYARILHVDVDALLARFQPRPVQVTEMARQREGGINQTFDDRRRFGTRSGAGAGGRWVWLALVVAGVAAGGWFGLDHMKQWLEARNSAAPAAHVEAQEQPAQTSESGTVTAALPPVMAGADSPAPSEALPASAPAAAASNAAVPVAVAAVAPAATVEPAAPVATTAPATAGSAQGELQIKFASDTWYEIRDRNGKVVLGGTAKAGQEVSGGGAAPYKVVIGNVKGVESMSRNGTPVDLKAANRNNVARLTLP